MRLKILESLGSGKRNGFVRYCQEKGCKERTREGKDYCSDHVGNHPYVKDLIARIEEKENEVQAVRKKGKKAVNENSETLKELKTHLAYNGPRTKARLTRELQLTSSGLEGFLDYMEEEKQITRSHTRRGDETVHLKND